MADIGVVGMGAMGSAIASTLRGAGHRVMTTLEGRSAASAERARSADVELVATLVGLLERTQVVLSIVPPSAARGFARATARAAECSGANDVLFVDCNAVSPKVVQSIGKVISAAGLRFADASISGLPPSNGNALPHLAVSGGGATELETMISSAVPVYNMGGSPGRASALKMCSSALIKGVAALHTESLVAAERLGVSVELRQLLSRQNPDQLETFDRVLPQMIPKAARWAPEMREIAATFSAVGLTPQMLDGAETIYRLIAEVYEGRAVPENVDALVRHVATAKPRKGPAIRWSGLHDGHRH